MIVLCEPESARRCSVTLALLVTLTCLLSCSDNNEPPEDAQLYIGVLHKAAASGDVAEVKRLIVAGTAVETTEGDKHGATSMHRAAEAGQQEVVALLVQQGGDVSARNKYLMTPLHYAAISGRTAVAQLLISSGADVDAENHVGWTPLFNSAMEGEMEVVSLLLSNGAAVEHVDNKGNTPLHYAAGNGETGSSSLLLDAGAPVNAANKSGETPLIRLKQRARWSPAKHRTCAELLVKHGAK